MSFEVDDVESEWPERAPFNFIHVRYMAGSIQDWPALLKNCYNSLSPGGWIECSDWDLLPYSTDGSVPEDDAMLKLHQYLVEATDKLGRTARPGPNLEKWVKDAGFVNVKHEWRVVPFGLWAKSKKHVRTPSAYFAEDLGHVAHPERSRLTRMPIIEKVRRAQPDAVHGGHGSIHHRLIHVNSWLVGRGGPGFPGEGEEGLSEKG